MRYIFIILESILYGLFIYLDFMSKSSVYVKYLSVILCFVFSLLFNSKKKESRFLILTSLLTISADLFLLVLDDYYEIGIAIFCVVQSIYALSMKKKTLIIRAVILVTLVVLFFMKVTQLQNLLAVYSITCLLLNVVDSFSFTSKSFTIGLILFALCDISVGLFNISDGIVGNIAGNLMWIFYLPSQVLIALSGGPHEKK